MKFNWGWGITIFLLLFIATLVFVLFKSFTVDHSLVRDDYYQEDITYQKKYDKIQNAQQQATMDINIDRAQGVVNLDFTKYQGAQGTIHFYRPSNKDLDFTQKIMLNNGVHSLPLNKLTRGKYKVKIDFKAGDKPYYIEKDIFI